MSRSRRAALLALAGLALALVAVGFFPQETLRRLVEHRLQSALGPAARIGALHVVPGTLRAEIRDLLLEGPGYRLEVPRVELALAPAALVGRGLLLRSLRLESPRLSLKPTGETASRGELLTQDLIVRELVLTGGRIDYSDPELGGLSLVSIDARGSLGDGTLELRAGGAHWDRRPGLDLTAAHVRAHVSPRLSVQLETLELTTSRSRLTARGALLERGLLAADLTLAARLDLTELATFVALVQTSGIVEADAHIAGGRDDVKVDASLRGEQLRLFGWPVSRAAARIERGPDNVIQASLDALLLGGRAVAEGRFDAERLVGVLRLSDIQAQGLARQIGTSLPPGEGRLSGELSLSGPLERLQARLQLEGRHHSTQAHVLLHGRSEGTLGLRPAASDLVWTLEAEARPAPAGPDAGPPSSRFDSARLALQGTARGAWPPLVKGDLTGSATLRSAQGSLPVSVVGGFESQGPRTTARLEAHSSAGELLAAAEARGADFERLRIEAQRIELAVFNEALLGAGGFAFEGSGPLETLTGTGTGRVEGLGWKQLDLGEMSLGIEARQGAARLSFELPRLHASGHATLESRPASPIRGNLELVDTPLAPLAPLLKSSSGTATPLAGQVTASLEMTLPPQRPQDLQLLARVQRLEAETERLAVHAVEPFEVELEGRRIGLRALHVQGTGFSLKADGRFGMAGDAPLDLRLVAEADLSRLPAPEGWTLAGLAAGEVGVGGSARRPRAVGLITASGVSAEGLAMPPLSLPSVRIALEGETLTIPETAGTFAGGAITISGRIPWAAALRGARRTPTRVASAERAALQVAWLDVALAQVLERMRPQAEMQPRASLSGQLVLEGGLTSLSEVRGELAATAATVQLDEVAIDVEPWKLSLDAGELRTDGITLGTPGGSFRLTGGIDLTRRRMNLEGKGRLELRVLSPFLEHASLSGAAEVDIAVQGPLDAPRPRGSVTVHDAGLRLRDFPQPVSEIQAQVTLDDTSVRLEKASAVFGGGTLAAEGGARLRGAALSDVRVALTGRDLALRYPVGLRSRSDVELSLTGASGRLLLAGDVRVKRAVYDLDLETMTAPESEPAQSPMLRAVGLDVRVTLENPVLVRNNLGRLQATGALTMRGDLETPAPFGRLEIEPGGQLLLQGRQFEVESGRLLYQGSWNASLTLNASTLIRNVERGHTGTEDVKVALAVGGSLDSPSLVLSTPSHPGQFSEPQIASIVATGRVGAGALGSTAWIFGEQAAGLLAGRLSEGLSASFEELGLAEVRISPELLAREGQPGARFTFGRTLARGLRAIYSLGLGGPESRYFELEARPLGSFGSLSLGLRRRDDGTFSFAAGQRFGSPRATRYEEERVTVREIRVDGLPDSAVKLHESVGVKPGDKTTFWALQDEADRLRQRLIQLGHIEAEAGVRLEGQTAVFNVRPGPVFRWRVEAMTDPPNLSREIRQALFEEEALERGRGRVLEALRARGHLRAEVQAEAVPQGDVRTLVFEARPGPRLAPAEVVFPGAAAYADSRLLEAAGGSGALMTDPDRARAALETLYRSHYYALAEIGRPNVTEIAPGRVRIEVPVNEGPRARVAAVEFDGATLPGDELKQVTSLRPGNGFDPAHVTAALARLQDHYLRLGYIGVRGSFSVRAEGPDLAVVFRLVEGERVSVGSVEIKGLRRTREWLVRRVIELQPGDPLDPRRLALLERRLLELGLFARATASVSHDNPATVTVSVEESRPLVFGYDARYGTDREGRGVLDGEARNLLGFGLALGLRHERGREFAQAGSQGRDFNQTRASFHLPDFGLGSLTLRGSRIEDLFPVNDFSGQPTQNRRLTNEVSAELSHPLPDRWSVLSGYRYRHIRFSSIIGEFTTRVIGIDLSLLRDTRDSPTDPRRGRFWSLSVEYSPRFLGSDLTFVKGFGQLTVARPVGSSLTWAHAYRLGLAHGFAGQRLDCPELFDAGGANSIRGFGSKQVGFRDPLCAQPGGQAVLVLNQELRYRHRSRVGAALFYDGGNVFRSVKDLGFDLRHAVGAGLRWESPVGLLRLDLGLPLSPHAGERGYQVFLSLGQAF